MDYLLTPSIHPTLLTTIISIESFFALIICGLIIFLTSRRRWSNLVSVALLPLRLPFIVIGYTLVGFCFSIIYFYERTGNKSNLHKKILLKLAGGKVTVKSIVEQGSTQENLNTKVLLQQIVIENTMDVN